MRDFDLVRAQVAAEFEARAQGPPSEEAAAQRKLRSVLELSEELAAGIHAAQMQLEFGRAQILRQHGELALPTSGFESVGHQKEADRRVGGSGGSSRMQAGRFGGVHPISLPLERRPARRRNWVPGGGSPPPRGERTDRQA